MLLGVAAGVGVLAWVYRTMDGEQALEVLCVSAVGAGLVWVALAAPGPPGRGRSLLRGILAGLLVVVLVIGGLALVVWLLLLRAPPAFR